MSRPLRFSAAFCMFLSSGVFFAASSARADQSLLGSRVPAELRASDGARKNYELGLKFVPSVNGQVKAIRFYKSPAESGSHTGKIYNASGHVLARVTFQGETASGWQQANLASALAVKANSVYVVSVNTGHTYYVDTIGDLASPIVSGSLTAPANGGVFGPVGKLPTQTWKGSDYFRDVVFAEGSASTSTATSTVTATATATSTASSTATATNTASATVTATSTSTSTGTSAIKNGQDLTIAMVGPAAIGITSFTKGNGVSIYDASSASYVKAVNASATYDGFSVSGPHLLIQGMDISGSFDISSSLPVVIRGSRIRGAGNWSVFARSGGPVYVLYCDVGGTAMGSPADETIMTGNAGGNVFARNHLSYIGDGFSIGSQNDQILENYVELFDPSGGAHNDGLQAVGDNNGMLIARNKILVNTEETGAINLVPWAGVAQYVTIESNYFAGGGYTFYGGQGGPSISNHIVVTNNIFGYDFFPNIGYWGAGPAYWDANGPGNLWQNNKDTKGNSI